MSIVTDLIEKLRELNVKAKNDEQKFILFNVNDAEKLASTLEHCLSNSYPPKDHKSFTIRYPDRKSRVITESEWNEFMKGEVSFQKVKEFIFGDKL